LTCNYSVLKITLSALVIAGSISVFSGLADSWPDQSSQRTPPMTEVHPTPIVAAVTAIDDLVPESFRPMLLATADLFGLDPRMVAAVVVVESEWIASAKGKHNDFGLMQIIPETARWIAKSLGMEAYYLFDAQTNLTMGTWYLEILFREYGNWPQALAAFNGGPRGADLGAAHPYTQKVMRAYGSR